MNLDHARTQSTTSHQLQSQVDTPLHRRWLVRGVWLALVILTLGIFFASLPVYLALLHTPCAGSACSFQQLTAEQAGALTGMGLSHDDYIAYTVALALASMVVCLVVSTVIVLRRSDNRMALLVALMLVTAGPLSATISVSASPSPWQVPNQCLSDLYVALFLLVFSLFPSGQFVPHWIRWTLAVFLAGLVPTAFIAPFMPNTPVDQLTSLVSVGVLATLAIVQLYRYRRVSSPMQHQQTKWVVFGFAVPITYFVIGVVLSLLFSGFAGPSLLYKPAFVAVQDVLVLLIPLSFGFAMLHSRLWEIDALMNKVLVYGLLTALLAAAYAGLILGLQGLLRGVIEQTNDIALVVSTLVIAALFQPLHRRIQTLIDRRFYRQKYDAAKTLAAFSAVLRTEVELKHLSEHVVAVVQETMHPTFVSLWLVKPEKRTLATSPQPGSPHETDLS